LMNIAIRLGWHLKWDYHFFCRFIEAHSDFRLLRADLPPRVTPIMLQNQCTASYWIESWPVLLRPLAAACVAVLRVTVDAD
jgi:hypothetical protein